MKVLGLDYGRKKIGLAVASSGIAVPYKVIRFSLQREAVKQVNKAVAREGIEKVVVGISEGEIGEETYKFGKEIKEKARVPVVYFDETLSTKDAQVLARQTGMKRKKRKALEDAFAAAVMLQLYIDSNSNIDSIEK